MNLVDAANRAWDVVVVGAGPAGSVAARELARRGRAVLLLDRATFPRAKVCGCCLNEVALASLAAVGLGDLVRRCRAVPLTQVRIAAGGRNAVVQLPGGVALSREAFDSELIREAVKAGVTFVPGVRVNRPGRKLHVTCGAESVPLRTKVWIAADGLSGQLAAEGGKPSAVATGSRIGAGVVADRAPECYQPGTISMAVGRGGYVGLVRVEDGRLDVAAAFDPGFIRMRGGPGAAAAAVIAESGLTAVPGLDGLPWRGTPSLTRTARRVAGEGWFAIGDAAGYVEPFTGEGMAWAIASAVAVAPLAARPWRPAYVQEWERTHRRLIRSRQATCRAAVWVLHSAPLSRLVVRLLSVAPVVSRPVIAALNRPVRHPVPTP